MKQAGLRSLAFALMLSAILVISVAYYWPIQEAYHPLNSAWNGCSRIANTTRNLELLTSYNMPIPHVPSLLVIIGPSIDFSKDETANVRSFLLGGGTVLLADDFGTGNSLLDALNVSMRLSGKPLADLYYFSKQHYFPLIGDFSINPLTRNLTTIVMNRPSFIEVRNSTGVIIFAYSSPFSFVDPTGEGRPARNATLGSYPVIAEVNVGNGRLVLVSDSSMFTNEMIDLYDNMRLFQNLLLMGESWLIFDTAHIAKAPLTDWRVALKISIGSFSNPLVSNESGVPSYFVVLVLLLIFSFGLIRIVRGRRQRK